MNLYQKMIEDIPQLVRGRVWCRTCGHTQLVSSAHCLAVGWPKCHGETMTIDSPAEREQFAKQQSAGSAP